MPTHTYWWWNAKWHIRFEKHCGCFQQSEAYASHATSHSPAKYWPKKNKTHIHTTNVLSFTAALFVIAQGQKQLRCLSPGEWIEMLQRRARPWNTTWQQKSTYCGYKQAHGQILKIILNVRKMSSPPGQIPHIVRSLQYKFLGNTNTFAVLAGRYVETEESNRLQSSRENQWGWQTHLLPWLGDGFMGIYRHQNWLNDTCTFTKCNVLYLTPINQVY